MPNVISHSDICATTSPRIKGSTPESVSTNVNEYASSMFNLIKDRLPTSSKDPLLVETPIIAYKINKKDSGVKKNADGTESKVGANYTANVAMPTTLLKILSEAAKILIDSIGNKKAA